MIESEAQPFAKTGGLADVLEDAASRARRRGWDAAVALPKYRGVSADTFVETFPVSVGGYTRDAGFFEAPLPGGARALLVDCPDLYDRDALYAPSTSTTTITRGASRSSCAPHSSSRRGDARRRCLIENGRRAPPNADLHGRRLTVGARCGPFRMGNAHSLET